MIVMVMVMIMIMMTMMMMILRMKTICDIINKSRIKVKVVMVMQIELVTAQNKGHCSLQSLIIKTSFIEIENKELHPCISSSIMLLILDLPMASNTIGIPPFCLQKFLPSPFSLPKILRPPPPKSSSSPCGIDNQCSLIGRGNYQDLDKMQVKLPPYFTRHNLITQDNIRGTLISMRGKQRGCKVSSVFSVQLLTENTFGSGTMNKSYFILPHCCLINTRIMLQMWVDKGVVTFYVVRISDIKRGR